MRTFQSWMYVLGVTAGTVLGYIGGRAELGLGFVLLALALVLLPAHLLPSMFSGTTLAESERRAGAEGREILSALSEEELASILGQVQAGHKIGAIKELRAIRNSGLRASKNAIDLLDAKGERWSESGQP